VAVEDPYDLTKLDAIKAMNLAPRTDFLVSLRPDIIDYINRSYGITTATRKEADLGPHHHGARQRRGGGGRRRRPTPTPRPSWTKRTAGS
jgi:hypothetical protein